MARPVKKGLDYFPTDVDIFSDTKLKIVRAHFGSDGAVLYFYLLCAIYKNGFYIVCDDDFKYVISADLGMTGEKIGQMLSFFLKRSLFDDTLFKADKILTSKGIQRRYQEAIKQRALKNPVQVDAKFWLLEKEETQSFIKVRPDENCSENNRSFSKNNDSFSLNNPHKVKESKVNKSKVNESSVSSAETETETTYGQHIRLKPSEYSELCGKYGEKVISDYIGRIDHYLEESGKRPYKNHYRTIMDWLQKDNVKEQSKPSYDLDEIFRNALENTPKINNEGGKVN